MPLTHFPHGLSSDMDFVGTAHLLGTSANVGSIVVPYDVELQTAYASIASGALGTAVSCIITADDTAGTALFTSTSMGASALTVGVVTVTPLSTKPQVAAGSAVCIACSSGTSVGVTVTVTGKRITI